jgi:SIT family siderophore-iron:H+ symporter-like MFS transporter
MTAQPETPRKDLESNQEYDGSSTTGRSVKNVDLIPEKSRGALQMERLQDRLDTKYRTLLYGSFAILAFILSMVSSVVLSLFSHPHLPGSSFSPTLAESVHLLVLSDRRHFLLLQCSLDAHDDLIDQVRLPSAFSFLASCSFLRADLFPHIQAVSQPPVAKIADVAGRLEAYAFCVFLYVLGYIVVSSANSSAFTRLFLSSSAPLLLPSPASRLH